VTSRTAAFAPVPDFRYVGLEPLPVRELGAVASAAVAIVAGVSLVDGVGLWGTDHALLTGAAAALAAVLVLGGKARRARRVATVGSVRMGIVPWGVLVHTDESPRILRWAAVRRIDIATSRAGGIWAPAISSRVVIETERDRFVGIALGTVPLDRLVAHLDAYTEEQATPIALDLEGAQAADLLESECESLFGAARGWLETASASAQLDLPPAGYRRTSVLAASPRAVEVLRRVLADRTPKRADPRAFAAVVAAELRAKELIPDLTALTQCPQPVVAAVAKQAAHKLGAPRSRIGALDEVAPFLLDGDRARLDAWIRAEHTRGP
jgi:hypothetical protein